MESFRSNLSIVHYNVQSFIHKRDILFAELSEFDIIGFTETWLDDNVTLDLLRFDSYIPFRRDRPGDKHGGILVFVRDNIPAQRRYDLEPNGIECLWLEIRLRNRKILVGTFYRPPNSTPIVLSSIENSIDLAFNLDIQDVIITGDFNLDMMKQASRSKVENIAQRYGMTQMISDPTHFTEHSSSLIDIFLVSNPLLVTISGVGEPFLDQNMRYHCPIFCCFKFSKPRCSTFKRRIWKYDQGGFNLLRRNVSAFDWDSCFDTCIDTYVDNFTLSLLELCNATIPNRIITVRKSDPEWMHNSIRLYIRRRKRAYDKAKRSNLQHDWVNYNQLRNETTSLIRKARSKHMEKLAEKLLSEDLSSSNFWKILKQFTKSASTNQNIPVLNHNNQFHTDNSDKANILNTFFQSQTLLDDANKVIPDYHLPDYQPSLSLFAITELEVSSVLKSLSTGKASGPDQINTRVLKELASELANPLCCLFNYALRLGIVPKKWKLAHVCAVHKKDDPQLVGNYRPISLLSCISKVLEKLIHKHMFNFFVANNGISSLQSGFVPNDSTVNQLAYIYHTFCQAMDEGKEIRAVFCDISKAFDRVWHKGLLYKLSQKGISGSLLTWLSDYLNGRRQCVVLNGYVSDPLPIQAGVPQGSILGPLLFVIFINDIVEEIQSNIRLFADDTSLYVLVEDPASAAVKLNADLSKISEWADNWLVTFNPSKTESIVISRKHTKPQHPPLTMYNTTISEVEIHKHLGVVLSSNGQWRAHLDMVKEKAWKRVNVLRSLKFILDRRSLEILFTTFVRPILEYSDVVWDNLTQAEEYDLEQIQLEALRIISGNTRLVSLTKLYAETGFLTLSSRRLMHRLILFYKMKNYLTPAYLASLVPELEVARYRTRNPLDVRPPRCRTQFYSNSFLPSTIKSWNNLPPEIRNSDSVSIFKSQINILFGKTSIPSYFYFGDRFLNIQHARLRTHCSNLKEHLYSKNIIEDPFCICGEVETSEHFFLECTIYDEHTIMVDNLQAFLPITIPRLLYGDPSLDEHSNLAIYKEVHCFIKASHRFCSASI